MALLAKHHKSICLTEQTFYKSWKILEGKQATRWDNVINLDVLLREPTQALAALVFEFQSLVVALVWSPASQQYMPARSPLARHQAEVRSDKPPKLSLCHRESSSCSRNSLLLCLLSHRKHPLKLVIFHYRLGLRPYIHCAFFFVLAKIAARLQKPQK
jgi:hypothetical protein